MKIKLMFLAALVGTGLFLWYRTTIPRSGPARAAVDRRDQNWGKVVPGSEVETSFTISNRGGEPLRLGKVKTSCGCTKSKLDVTTLLPGTRTTLRVGFLAPVNLGSVRHSVSIPTNDPENPVLEMNLFAEAWLGVKTVPQSIDTGYLRPGAVIERLIQLHSPDGRPFKLKRVITDDPEIRVDPVDTTVAAPVHRARVTYRAGDLLGAVRGSVRFLTDREDAPSVDVVIGGQVTGPVVVSPATLEIARSDIGQVVRRTLILQGSPPDKALGLTSVHANAPWELLDKKVKSFGPGRMTLEVSLRFPEGNGLPAGDLDLTFSAPETFKFRIPLKILGWTPPPPPS